MSTTGRARRELPELPLTGWEETKLTLHLWAQIVGKVRSSWCPGQPELSHILAGLEPALTPRPQEA